MHARNTIAIVAAVSGAAWFGFSSGCTTTSRRGTTPTETIEDTATATVTLTYSHTDTATPTSTNTPVPSPTFAPTGWVYVAGGHVAYPNASTSVYSNWVGTGAMGPAWNTGAPLPVPVDGARMLWDGAYLVQAGGEYWLGPSGTPTWYPLPDVYSAPASGGVVSPWVSQPPLPAARVQGGLAVESGHLYFAGGWSTQQHADTYAAPLSAGVVGAWAASTPVPSPVSQFGYADRQGEFLLIGGWGPSGGWNTYSALYRSTMAGGAFGTWNAAGSLPAGWRLMATAIWGDYVYIFGGWIGTSPNGNVRYGRIVGGAIASWSIGVPMPAVLWASQAFAYNGHVYVVGGAGIAGFQSTVYVAAINPNYSIGAWGTMTPLPKTLYDPALAVGN